jgi:predicted secreted Zn-dependent protease
MICSLRLVSPKPSQSPLRPLNIEGVSAVLHLKLVLACLLVPLLTACGGDGGGSDDSSGPRATASGSGIEVQSEGIKLESGLATSYYNVQGMTTEDIFRYIEQNGPTLEDGTRGSGITSVVWAYDWTGSQDSNGCRIDSMTIRADISVLLPRHANEANLPPDLRKNWLEYETGVAIHEQRHVDIYLEGAADIKSVMSEIGRQKDCKLLESKVETVWSEEQARINGLQQDFHHDEDLRLAARRQPLEAQIQANRSRLATMQGQISALERQIAGLKNELGSLDSQLDSVEAQIDQITDQFPGVLPETIRTRLESLVIERNELLGSYNTRVDVHNKALSDRTTLIASYDPLLAATNALVEQYNWSR